MEADLVRVDDETAAVATGRDGSVESSSVTRARQPTGDPVLGEDVRAAVLTSPLLMGARAVVVLHTAERDAGGDGAVVGGVEDGATALRTLPVGPSVGPPSTDIRFVVVAARVGADGRTVGEAAHGVASVATLLAAASDTVPPPCGRLLEARDASPADRVLTGLALALGGVAVPPAGLYQAVLHGDRRAHGAGAVGAETAPEAWPRGVVLRPRQA